MKSEEIKKCAFYLFDDAKNQFTMKSWYGFHPSVEEQTVLEIDSLPFLKLATTRKPIFIQDPVAEIELNSLNTSENESTVVLNKYRFTRGG